MASRAHNWEYLFDPATGYLGARNGDGSFPSGPAFQTSEFEPGGENGFEEGNAIQYTWSVPQDLGGLAALMGGDADATADLDTFFSQLNASRYLPYDWSGNEPNLGTPWEFDYFGAPSRTQGVVRAIVNTQYADAPVDEPGNDDLGAISSWYVWAAIGLYPVTPGSADLALASPLFPDTVLTLSDGKTLVEHAPAASADTPYVSRLRMSGVAVAASAPRCGSKSVNSSRARTATGSARGCRDRSSGAAGRWPSPCPRHPTLAGPRGRGTHRPRSPRAVFPPWVTPPPPVRSRLQPAVRPPCSSGSTAREPPAPRSTGPPRVPASPCHPPRGSSGRSRPAARAAVPLETLTVTGTSAGTYDLRVALETSAHVALPPVVVAVTVVG